MKGRGMLERDLEGSLESVIHEVSTHTHTYTHARAHARTHTHTHTHTREKEMCFGPVGGEMRGGGEEQGRGWVEGEGTVCHSILVTNLDVAFSANFHISLTAKLPFPVNTGDVEPEIPCLQDTDKL